MTGPSDPTRPDPAAAPGAALGAYADSFARLAVANITRAYPNFPGHLVAGPEDLAAPRAYHPVFYGAYDWHSSVHMHWLAMRLLHRHGLARETADEVVRVLDAHLTRDGLAAEARYLRAAPTFERPYGWAWLLVLTAESADAADGRWSAALAPAARAVAGLLLDWLPRARYPVRHGTHANSAFSLGLVLDSAERAGVPELVEPVRERLRAWFLADRDASPAWEPSGQDFLSPLLAEADAMRRVLDGETFTRWASAFLPVPTERPLFVPPEVTDPADPQIGHLHGLCFSRAAALHALAAALPGDRAPALRAAADEHLRAGARALGSGDFTTDHWLASFAVLALEAAAGPPARGGPGQGVRQV